MAEQNKGNAAAGSAETCPVRMHLGELCGRPSVDPTMAGFPSCLMHTPEGKDEAAFQHEFERILLEAGTNVADFTGFVFPSANYERREFKARCVFCSATFTQNADFGKATFTQNADFSGATFTQDAYFNEATFTQNADFGKATFTQDAYFNGATFSENANFSEATFTRDAYFNGATFSENAYFSKATFTLARFGKVTFTQNAYFSEATFTEYADFGEVTFTQNAYFSETTFTREAYFNGATFSENAYFSKVTFTQNAYFGATFTQSIDFSGAQFTKIAYFNNARFLGAAGFRETKFRQNEERVPGPVFSLAEFSRPAAIVFYKTYMAQALFHNCEASKLTFSSVEWRKRKKGGKLMVFEEVVNLDEETAVALKPKQGNPDEREYGLIAELYQQLKKNYDERKDYWTAGHFHYGELEMKRLHSQSEYRLVRWLHRNLGLVAWYKYASQYGESYIRPAVVLLIILAIFTLLLPWAGLDRNEDSLRSPASATQQNRPPATTSELSYKRFTDFVGTYPGQKRAAWAAFFANSLMTALSEAGLQKELKYEPSYPWGRALALMEVLITSTLGALFLLAVRRQFKR